MRKTIGNILIFLATSFEEELVSQCVVQMRSKGLSFQIVGAEDKLLYSYHGLSVYPDLSIEHLLTVRGPELILIPGESACTSLLMSDPRIFFYLENFLSQNGHIAISKKAGATVAGAGLHNAYNLDQFFHQEERNTSDFVAELISWISQPILWKIPSRREENFVPSPYRKETLFLK